MAPERIKSILENLKNISKKAAEKLPETGKIGKFRSKAVNWLGETNIQPPPQSTTNTTQQLEEENEEESGSYDIQGAEELLNKAEKESTNKPIGKEGKSIIKSMAVTAQDWLNKTFKEQEPLLPETTPPAEKDPLAEEIKKALTGKMQVPPEIEKNLKQDLIGTVAALNFVFHKLIKETDETLLNANTPISEIKSREVQEILKRFTWINDREELSPRIQEQLKKAMIERCIATNQLISKEEIFPEKARLQAQRDRVLNVLKSEAKITGEINDERLNNLVEGQVTDAMVYFLGSRLGSIKKNEELRVHLLKLATLKIIDANIRLGIRIQEESAKLPTTRELSEKMKNGYIDNSIKKTSAQDLKLALINKKIKEHTDKEI